MAAFDANLLLLNNTSIASAGGVALVTGAFVDLGTGGTAAKGLTIRMSLNSANADASTLQVTYQTSDNSSTVQEQFVLPSITGTDARAAGSVERITVFGHRRRYVRYLATVGGVAGSFTGTVGIDAGEIAQVR